MGKSRRWPWPPAVLARTPAILAVFAVMSVGLLAGCDDDDRSTGQRAKAGTAKPTKPSTERHQSKNAGQSTKSSRETAHQSPHPSPTGPRGIPSTPPRARKATIVSVADGDTVEITQAGDSRIIGVDTPEVYFGAECYGSEASSFTKGLFSPGETVYFTRGVERFDHYDRALIYLWTADGRFFNAELARLGYAVPLTIAPNSRYAPLFDRLAQKAERKDRGLWSKKTCDGDPDLPAGSSPSKPMPSPPPAGGGSSGGGSGSCTAGYSPCLAPMSDYDCAGGEGDGPGYAEGPVRVSGPDPYGLDADGDGVACE